MSDDFLAHLAVARLNILANQPDVLPFIAPPGAVEIDLSPILKDDTVVMWCPPGAIVAQHLLPGVYELHWLMPRAMTGAQKRRAAEKALAALFLQHGAHMVLGKTPVINRAARFMNHALGGRETGRGKDSYGRECVLYALERKTWMPLSFGGRSPTARKQAASLGASDRRTTSTPATSRATTRAAATAR